MKTIISILYILLAIVTQAQVTQSVSANKTAVIDLGSTDHIAEFDNDGTVSTWTGSATIVDTVFYVPNGTNLSAYTIPTRPTGLQAGLIFNRGASFTGTLTINTDSLHIAAIGTTGSEPVISLLAIDTVLYPNISINNVNVSGYSYNTNYYISNSGNDSNDGLTPETAWQTITKVNEATFEPGDHILFKRGDEWRSASILVDFSGEPGNPIVIGDYGTGAKPIFNGAERVTDWTAHPTRANTWVTKAKAISPEAYRTVAVMDDNRCSMVLFSELNAEYQYSAVDKTGTANDSIYIYSPTDPSLRFTELSTVTNGITDGINNDPDSCITIKNISFKYYGYYGIDFRHRVSNAHIVGNILVDSCDFYFIKHGGVQFYNGHEYNTVQNSTVSYCGNGIYANQADNITFTNNTLINTIEYLGGIGGGGFTDGHSVGMFLTSGTVVENNRFESDGEGGAIIGVDQGGGTIRYNKFIESETSSIAVHRTNPNDTLYVYYNDIHQVWSTPLMTDTVYNTSMVKYYNNTVVSEGVIWRSFKTDNVEFKNNLFYSKTGTYLFTMYDSILSLVSDYNLFYKGGSYFAWWQSVPSQKSDNLTEWQIDSGQDANSVSTNPLFTTNFTDLRLQTGSPAINAGVNLGLPNRDILGNPIVGLPDIGAYEKQ